MSLDTDLLDGPYETVFDVGAFRGDFARACLAAWPCTVLSFEPLEPPPVEGPGTDRWRWIPVAVGPGAEEQQMWRCEFVPSSSFLPMADLHREAFPYTANGEQVTVPVRSLRSYAAYANGRTLLKVDVQGYEVEVLWSAGPMLSRFDAVVLEVSHAHLYDGAPHPDVVAGFLEDEGYRHVRTVDELRHPKTRVLLQSDELWAR